MVSQPRRRRTTAPEPVPKSIPGPSPAPEWRLRLALGLLAISGLSALFNVLAVLALGGAIANLGAPQGPLDFALVFIGAVVGLGGDAVIVAGTLAVVRPGTRFAGHPERVSWGLGLQLLASALVGLLESSWAFALVYVLLLAGLAYLWVRTSPAQPPKPVARHAVPEPEPLNYWEPDPSIERFPIPWIGNAPLPPSTPRTIGEGAQGTDRGQDPSGRTRRGSGF